jgi:hypothetical protein
VIARLEERRGALAIELSAARVVDEVEDVSLLLPERRVHGENTLDEATAFFGVGSVAGLATEDLMDPLRSG